MAPSNPRPVRVPDSIMPSPTGSGIAEVVKAVPQETLVPVPISAPVRVTNAFTVKVVAMERVNAQARRPGEIGGRALAVRIGITNTGPGPVDLGDVSVNVRDAAGVMSAPLSSAPAAPLDGALESRGNADGVYLFDFGEGRAEPVTVEISAAVGAPVAVFVGPTT